MTTVQEWLKFDSQAQSVHEHRGSTEPHLKNSELSLYGDHVAVLKLSARFEQVFSNLLRMLKTSK